jgi:serine/threonine protein kinase
MSLKVVQCAIQILECLDHAHSNGVNHLNLHPGNVFYVSCADREETLGCYVTDFGDPLMLSEDIVWTEQHEKIYTRMLKF